MCQIQAINRVRKILCQRLFFDKKAQRHMNCIFFKQLVDGLSCASAAVRCLPIAPIFNTVSITCAKLLSAKLFGGLVTEQAVLSQPCVAQSIFYRHGFTRCHPYCTALAGASAMVVPNRVKLPLGVPTCCSFNAWGKRQLHRALQPVDPVDPVDRAFSWRYAACFNQGSNKQAHNLLLQSTVWCLICHRIKASDTTTVMLLI